jgi:hypothetical protein
MDKHALRCEITVLLCHYLRQKHPSVYVKFCAFAESRRLLPRGVDSVDTSLDCRYSSLPADHFYRYVESLRPKDDYASIFRCVSPPPTLRADPVFDGLSAVRRLFCHSAAIICVASDPLSRVLITGSDDGAIKIWTVPDLRPVARLSGHELGVTSVSLNCSCTLLLSSSGDHTARLWSLRFGRCVSVLRGFTGSAVNSAAFSPPGSLVGAACADGTVAIWTTRDALDGLPPLRVVESRGGSATCISFSPGGEFVAFCPQLTVCTLKTMSASLLGARADLVRFAQSHVSTGPRMVAACKSDGAVSIWDIDGGAWRQRHVFRDRRPGLLKCGFDREEHLLVIVRPTGIVVCDCLSGETVRYLPLVFKMCRVIVGHPIRRELFLLANSVGAVCVIDVVREEVVCDFRVEDGRPFCDAIWSSDGRHAFLADEWGSVTVLQCGGVVAGCVSEDIFVSVERGVLSDLFFCDRAGDRLFPQPRAVDIRTLDLQLETCQAPALRSCAVELKLIQKMGAGNDRQAPAPAPPRDIPAPPRHIRLRNDMPINPHGAPERPLFVRSSDVPVGIWPEWATAIGCHDSVYLPHIGDDVVIFRRSYVRMVGELGVVADATFPERFRGFVVDVGQFDRGMRLQVMQPETRKRFEVIFPVPEIVSFLMLFAKWKAAVDVAESLWVSDDIAARFVVDEGTITAMAGKVIAIGEGCVDDPDLAILVDWGDTEGRVSPWDIVAVNGQAVIVPDSSLTLIQNIAEFKVVLDDVVGDPKNAAVVHCPREGVERVDVPCSFWMIKERIEGRWYRRFAGIVADLRLVTKNAGTAYGKGSPEWQLTKELPKKLMNAMNGIAKALQQRPEKGQNKQMPG